jgi:hypothetical protein
MPAALQNHILTDPWKDRGTAATGVLKALAYFDIFQYPLTKKEIRQYLDQSISEEELEEALKVLLINEYIFLQNGFFSLQDNPLPACKRIKGNQRASQLLPKAERIGRFLYRFPFVRGIGISGSLSKNFAEDKADIDFFIITKKNRLWIARTLMHLFKKLTFLAGQQHFYCMNYYVDEQVLLLHEQNIFTAIEIKTLLPVSGEEAIDQFFTTNQWCNTWLPACEFRKPSKKDTTRHPFKQMAEWICANRVGDWIDDQLMRISNRRWKRKEKSGKRNQKGVVMGLRTDKHFARSNPGSFQEKVLKLYKERLDQLGI